MRLERYVTVEGKRLRCGYTTGSCAAAAAQAAAWMLLTGEEVPVSRLTTPAGVALELPVEEVNFAMDAIASPVSLYDPIYSDGGDPLTVMDQVKDTRNTDERWMEHMTLQSAFRKLGRRERQILCLRFYDGKTQMEVAAALGISQAQVSRLEKNAIRAMRKSVCVS